MVRFRLLLIQLLVGLSVVTGSIAHATEPAFCIDNVSAQSMGHSVNDNDQVPADADMDHPHHHGGCHGHQVADHVSEPELNIVQIVAGHISVMPDRTLPAAPVDPAVRPPIA